MRMLSALTRGALLLAWLASLTSCGRTSPRCLDNSEADAGLPSPRPRELPWDNVAVHFTGAVVGGGHTEVTWEVEHGGRRLSYEPAFGNSILSTLQMNVSRGSITDRVTITLGGEARETAAQACGLVVRETRGPRLSWETALHVTATWGDSPASYIDLDASAYVTFVSVPGVPTIANVARPADGDSHSVIFRIQSNLDVTEQWRLTVASDAPLDTSGVPAVVRLEPRASRDFMVTVGPFPSGVDVGRLVDVRLERPETKADIAGLLFTTVE